MESQKIDNLKGEVEFRKKLARQHVTGEMLLPDYFTRDEHDKILLERMNTTAGRMAQLQREGVRLAPFLELGAERGQRSLVLANDFNAAGFAADISFHQLKTAEHFGRLFNKPKLPHRVCCDVNNLPFRNGSIPFVFCYEFLHHFPSPTPIVAEAFRVLSGGVFLFAEEPFRRPRLVLYQQNRKLYAQATLRRNRLVRFIEGLFSEECCDEREHGIIENHDLSLQAWIDSLSLFDEKTIHASSLGGKVRTRLAERVQIRNLPNVMLGGGVEGLCVKKGAALPQTPELTDLFVCPNCLANSRNGNAEMPPLERKPERYACVSCGSAYPVVDDIVLLLPPKLLEALYPEFAPDGAAGNGAANAHRPTA